MSLSLNQILFLILTVVGVVVLVFLVRFLIQLTRTAREGEKALVEAQGLLADLRTLEKKLNARVDDVGQILDSSKKTVAGAAEIAQFVAGRALRPVSAYWPIIYPLLRFGWKKYRKHKNEKKERDDVAS
jgi:hypothetical protein